VLPIPKGTAKTPRRRAKQARAQQTIAVVLEAAAQVLQHEGHAGATTNRIAERAGVSIGTIYQYFANKDEIFDALMRSEIKRILRVLESATRDPDEPIADGLRRLLQLLVQELPDAPPLYRALEQVPNGLFRRRVAEARGSVLDSVRGFLASHRSEIRVPDIDIAAFVIAAAAEGVAINASTDFYRSRCADELTMVFARYLTGSSA